jgi:hypothetical protein
MTNDPFLRILLPNNWIDVSFMLQFSVVYCVAVAALLRNSLKDVSKVTDDEAEVRKWLRQESEDFNATGFDALVKAVTRRIQPAGHSFPTSAIGSTSQSTADKIKPFRCVAL